MGEALSEEMEEYVRKKAHEEIEHEIAKTKWEAQKIFEKQLAEKLEPLLVEVEKELENRGFDTDNPAIQDVATKSLISAAMGEVDLGETVEISLAGKENGSTEFTMPPVKEPSTKTIEVPIEGGDVEDPETVEKEVLDPDMSELVSGESLDEWADRHNVGQRNEDQNQDSEDKEIPKAGLPWYQ